ncbi:glycine N-acyltransferase-like protein 3 [Brachyhypopomus gauderio]|uniref:glycine N-acyltransferase-like protein 3 n=1 Tax=Brachyhypopomus gauderio TaxID=698409 RepID=UPI0040412866
METLTKEKLKRAEKTLRQYLPKSQQVYGCVFLMGRVQADPMEVMVDRWPDFSVMIIKPKVQEVADLFKDGFVFTKDEASLRNILEKTDFLDKKQYFCTSVATCHEEVLKAVAAAKGVPKKRLAVCRLMTLPDLSNLTNDRLSVQTSSLTESHIDLVNSTWKFGAEGFSKRMVRDMIVNFPSSCVLDADGHPVSWILTYSSCAMGMLYTLPEHRKKGYAKAVVSALAKKLHSGGYPVFCFIEENNQLSYRLFRSLGFNEDSSYRFAWYDFHERPLTPL